MIKRLVSVCNFEQVPVLRRTALFSPPMGTESRGSCRTCLPRALHQSQAEHGAWVAQALWLLPPCQTIVAGFPGETSPGMGRGNHMLPVTTAALGSSRTATTSEHLAAGEEASYASLHGESFVQQLSSIPVELLEPSLVKVTATDSFSLQALAWQACSRVFSSFWCRSYRRHGSSRHCWRALPVTPSPISTSSPTAWCRWERPCTSSYSIHRCTLAPSATTCLTCPFLKVVLGCPAPLALPTPPLITKRSLECPQPPAAHLCECHQPQG